jgi:hypothetical protein
MKIKLFAKTIYDEGYAGDHPIWKVLDGATEKEVTATARLKAFEIVLPDGNLIRLPRSQAIVVEN